MVDHTGTNTDEHILAFLRIRSRADRQQTYFFAYRINNFALTCNGGICVFNSMDNAESRVAVEDTEVTAKAHQPNTNNQMVPQLS